ncbi:trimethylamine methyltransferase family protein [Thermofilum pendens]|uniref:Trimethylamine:corrinoid methyltransferase n=1 Tax=Thermofilum pendens (strain DSM 2475 / Hrk 5) TaxID=368408 RepID=A1S084_THEPD|nr:trimethylamine methyltransferase family protein [Thermofilum pendens]ABL78864.1 trimethylamine:corrinoid methyltransferase [Thermofilum pendens Hrk 5]
MVPSVSVLSRREAEEITGEALRVLETVGVFFEDKGVERIALEGGGRLKDGRVLIPEDVVKEALRTAPRRIRLYDRDGREVAVLGEGARIFNPGSAAIRILDHGSQTPRNPTLEDLKKLVIVADYLKGLKAQSTALVPFEVPAEVKDAVRLYVVLKYSGKPVVTGAFTVENLPLMVEMLGAVREDYAEKPFAIFDVCPTPPLSWSTVTSRNLVDLARLGVPAEIISMPGLGATSPVTVYGAIIQHHAEVLSGIALSQLVKPGAPVIYGGSPTMIHPYYGTPSITAPEAVLISLAYRDLARYLDLPSHTYMGLSDSKTVDYQAGAETAYTAALAALAGFDVISGAGMLEYESVQSLEKLVLDNEACLIAERLARGVEVDPQALDALKEGVLEKKGNFLALRHTRQHYRSEILVPKVWDLAPRAKSTGVPLAELAHREVERILAEHKPPLLDGDALRRLDAVYSKLWESHGLKPVPPP